MLLENLDTNELDDIEDSNVHGSISKGTHRLVGGPGAKFWVALPNGRFRPYSADVANRRILSGGQYLTPADVERMRSNNEFASSGMGAIAAGAAGIDDYLFAGLGGAAGEALGVFDEGVTDSLSRESPWIYHGMGAPSALIAGFLSGGQTLAARSAVGAGQAAKVAATASAKAAVANAAQRRTLGQAALEASKKVISKGSNFTLPGVGARLGIMAEQAASPAVSALAKTMAPRVVADSRLVQMFGPHMAKIIGGAVGGAVDGGVWGLGEGLSESMAGPPEEVGEHVLSSIGTNALIGSAFGGAITSILPALSGLKASVYKGTKSGLDLVGWGGRKVSENSKEYLRTQMKNANEWMTDKQVDLVMEFFGDNFDEASKRMEDLASGVDTHIADISELVTAVTFLEDLVQMADKNGFSQKALIDFLERKQQYRPADDIGIPFGVARSKDASGARGQGELPFGDPAKGFTTGEVDVPGQGSLFTGAQAGVDVDEDGPIQRSVIGMIENQSHFFRRIRTQLLDLLDDDSGAIDPDAIAKIYDRVINNEAKYYKRLFDRDARQRVEASYNLEEPSQDEIDQIIKWEKYWEERRPEVNGSPAGPEYGRLEQKLKEAHAKKYPNVRSPDTRRAIDDPRYTMDPEPRAAVPSKKQEELFWRKATEAQKNIDAFNLANERNRANPLVWETVAGGKENAVFDQDYGWTSKSTRELEELIKDPKNLKPAKQFLEQEIAKTEKDIPKHGLREDTIGLYKENDAKKKLGRLKELLSGLGEEGPGPIDDPRYIVDLEAQAEKAARSEMSKEEWLESLDPESVLGQKYQALKEFDEETRKIDGGFFQDAQGQYTASPEEELHNANPEYSAKVLNDFVDMFDKAGHPDRLREIEDTIKAAERVGADEQFISRMRESHSRLSSLLDEVAEIRPRKVAEQKEVPELKLLDVGSFKSKISEVIGRPPDRMPERTYSSTLNYVQKLNSRLLEDVSDAVGVPYLDLIGEGESFGALKEGPIFWPELHKFWFEMNQMPERLIKGYTSRGSKTDKFNRAQKHKSQVDSLIIEFINSDSYGRWASKFAAASKKAPDKAPPKTGAQQLSLDDAERIALQWEESVDDLRAANRQMREQAKDSPRFVETREQADVVEWLFDNILPTAAKLKKQLKLKGKDGGKKAIDWLLANGLIKPKMSAKGKATKSFEIDEMKLYGRFEKGKVTSVEDISWDARPSTVFHDDLLEDYSNELGLFVRTEQGAGPDPDRMLRSGQRKELEDALENEIGLAHYKGQPELAEDLVEGMLQRDQEEYLQGMAMEPLDIPPDPEAYAASARNTWDTVRRRLQYGIDEANNTGSSRALRDLFEEYGITDRVNMPEQVIALNKKHEVLRKSKKELGQKTWRMSRMHNHIISLHKAWINGARVTLPDPFNANRKRTYDFSSEARRRKVGESGDPYAVEGVPSPFDDPSMLKRGMDSMTGNVKDRATPVEGGLGPDGVYRPGHFLADVQSHIEASGHHDWDIELYAEGWKDMERIMSILHDEMLGGALAHQNVQELLESTLMNDLRKYLKDEKLWGGIGVQKENFDTLAMNFKKSVDNIRQRFLGEAGTYPVADPKKVTQYILGLDSPGSFSDTQNLQTTIQWGLELLQYLGKNFEAATIKDMSSTQVQRFNLMLQALGLPTTDDFLAQVSKSDRLQKEMLETMGESPEQRILEITEEIEDLKKVLYSKSAPESETRAKIQGLIDERAKLGKLAREPDLEDVWEKYIETLTKRMEYFGDNLDDHLRFLREELPMTQMFLGLGPHTANLQGAMDQLGRGGAAGAMTWALTGSTGLAGVAGLGVGASSLAQDPRRLANFIYLSRKMHKSSKEHIKDSMDNWVKNELPKSAKTRDWEIKARQMLMVGTQVGRRDRDEYQTKTKRKRAKKQRVESVVNKARRTFASEITEENYRSAAASLTSLVNSRIMMERFLNQSTMMFKDMPDLRNSMKESIRKRIQAAHRLMPRPTPGMSFGADIPPNSVDLAKWGRQLQILDSPVEVILGSMFSGSLTTEMVDTLRDNWPNIYQEIVIEALQATADPAVRAKLNAAQRQTLSTLTGGNFVSPDQTQRLQKNFRPPDKEPGPQAQGPTTTTGFDTTAQAMGIGTMTGLLNRQYV